jgi:hypothetical protein
VNDKQFAGEVEAAHALLTRQSEPQPAMLHIFKRKAIIVRSVVGNSS